MALPSSQRDATYCCWATVNSTVLPTIVSNIAGNFYNLIKITFFILLLFKEILIFFKKKVEMYHSVFVMNLHNMWVSLFELNQIHLFSIVFLFIETQLYLSCSRQMQVVFFFPLNKANNSNQAKYIGPKQF